MRCLRSVLLMAVIVAITTVAEPVVMAQSGAVPDVASRADHGPVTLDARFSPATLSLSATATLTITITRPENYSLEPKIGDAALRESFVIRDIDEQLPRLDGDKVIVSHVFHLEPLEPGSITVQPVSYTLQPDDQADPVVVQTKPLQVEVITSIESATPRLSDVEPPAGPQTLPPDPFRFLRWVAVGMLIVAAALVLIVRKRKPPPPPPPLTPAEVARRDLDALRGSAIAETDIKEFYVRLTGIVRVYVEGTTGILSPRQTTDEFLREIEGRDLFSHDEQSRFREFLESADLVKYAAHQPTSEDIASSLAKAESFVSTPVEPSVEAPE